MSRGTELGGTPVQGVEGREIDASNPGSNGRGHQQSMTRVVRAGFCATIGALTEEVPMERRFVLRSLTLAGIAVTVPGIFAQELVRTPPQTEGPFYPDKLPLDTDNDLLIINDRVTSAVGEITWLSGRVVDRRGDPIRNALVEIWQVDRNGVYLHSDSGNARRRDSNFQGFGRFTTGSTGEYVFRTIKPVPYPGRAPHIHFKIKVRGRDPFTTQCYVRGEPLNAKDGVLNSIRDPRTRASVLVPFVAMPESRIGELAAQFNIVLA
jgi:protocatechuate 3,4-dioxygenase, beta subunit